MNALGPVGVNTFTKLVLHALSHRDARIGMYTENYTLPSLR